jgi:purine-binding chemotaxis protein CheW
VTALSDGYLIVRAAGRQVGLALDQVVEVLDPGDAFPVPAVEPAVRGVTSIRGRIMPLVHLGALLDGSTCPTERGDTAVVVELSGHRLCLEVEAAESVLQGSGLPVPADRGLPWAVGVARTESGLLPLLDLTALAARITECSAA